MTPPTMRQISTPTLEFAAYGLETVERPVPRANEVLVRLEATALGYVDGLITQGKYQIKPSLPYVPGGEIAGVVVEAGNEVQGVGIGDRIATWQLGGGFADFVVVSADQVEVLPAGLAAVAAAASLVDYQTARYALVERAALKASERVLILGASGGVGSAAIQFAVRLGAQVIAAASTSTRRAAALSQGAVDTVDSSSPDMRGELRAKNLSGAIDVIFDPVGGPHFEAMFRSLAKEGRHLVVGFAAGAIPALPANLALLKSASLIGVDIRHFLAAHPEAAAVARRDIFARLAMGDLLPPIVDIYPFESAMEALAATSRRDKSGKLVVRH